MADPGGMLVPQGDPQLAPSRDPERARTRLLSALLAEPDGGSLRQDVLQRLAEHGAALADRATSPAHLTASALVVDHERRHVVAMLHTKLGRWLQPGGHADGDTELAGVALREASEETGIDGLRVLVPAVDLDVHRVDHGDALGEHLHLDLRFVVLAPAGARLRRNHESTEMRWVTPGQLAELTDEESFRRLAERGLAALEGIS